jgi:pyruvate formate lyase activating enzyme
VRIGGFQKFSLSDFPGKISAVVFAQGCNFRCRYCHNPELVDRELYATPMNEDGVIDFLESRTSQLQGIVLTGGEPTLQADLESIARRFKRMGYAVKLDTNGSNPVLLERLITSGLLDYIAMDVKAPFASYSTIVSAEVRLEDIESAIDLIKDSGVSHEMRTTYIPQLLTMEDMRAVGDLVKGCERYVLQQFVPSKTLDPAYLALSAPSSERLIEIRDELRKMGVRCFLSGCFT